MVSIEITVIVRKFDRLIYNWFSSISGKPHSWRQQRKIVDCTTREQLVLHTGFSRLPCNFETMRDVEEFDIGRQMRLQPRLVVVNNLCSRFRLNNIELS